MMYLYVLKCSQGKYYIGKTDNLSRRFNDHLSGNGSTWTKKYKPIKMIENRELKDEYDEDNTTKTYMKKYGIENVRGGSFTQVTLPDDVVSVLNREFNGSNDECFKCGKTGHFVRNCPGEEIEWCCENCDRTFTTRFGAMVHEKSCKKKRDVCYRCGRFDHRSPQCYARTHADGSSLIETLPVENIPELPAPVINEDDLRSMHLRDSGMSWEDIRQFNTDNPPPKSVPTVNGWFSNVFKKIDNEFTNPESHLRKFFK